MQLAFPQQLLHRTSSLHLALHISSHQVQALLHEVTGDPVWSFAETIEKNHAPLFEDAVQWLEQTGWSKHTFRQVSVSFDTPDFTLVPSGFVEEGKEHELLDFQNPSENHDVRVEHISESGIAVVYALPQELQPITRLFPASQITPSVALFLRYTWSQKHRQHNHFFIYFQPHYLLVNTFANGELKLTNHFGVQGPEDVLYHLANASMRLHIELEEARMIMCGGVDLSETETLLKNYCNHVQVWQLPDMWKQVEVPMTAQQFPTLLHLLCA